MKVIRPVLATLLLLGPVASELSEEVAQMALEWAPLVWMHGEDPFYPSSVQFHLDNMEVRDANETLAGNQSNPPVSS